jgi:hypothetical protein
MLSMTTSTAHVALYDNLADWEFGHLLVELRTGRFTGHPWKAVSVAGSREPITSRGGLRMVPDMILDPADSNLLILPGADMWDAGGGTAFAAAAICGATAGSSELVSWTTAATPGAEYRTNPAHRRAKLLACTEAGYWAIRRISFVAHPFRNRIGAQLATDELRNTLMTMRHLVALEADQRPPND